MHSRLAYMASIVIFLCYTMTPDLSLAKEFKASLAQMPTYAEDNKNGILIDLLREIEKKQGTVSKSTYIHLQDRYATLSLEFTICICRI